MYICCIYIGQCLYAYLEVIGIYRSSIHSEPNIQKNKYSHSLSICTEHILYPELVNKYPKLFV